MGTRDKIQNEALKKLLTRKRAGAAITMGGGKTLIGLKHMNAHHKFGRSKFLVVAPTVSIQKGWVEEAKKHNLEHLIDCMTFTTYRSINKQELDYDIVYLDECHSLLFSHQDYLAKYKGRILGLTGTPPRYDKSEKGQMVRVYCPIIYEYDTDAAVAVNMLNDYKIVVHLLDLNFRKTLPQKTKTGKVFMTSEVSSYNYWCERIDLENKHSKGKMLRVMRMKALMNFPSKTDYAKKILRDTSSKVLLFANTKEQADSFGIPSFHSGNKNSKENLEKFKDGRIMQMSCILQLSEGVNIPNLKSGIIMHAYGNERKTAQRIGRLLRLNPKECATAHILCYRDTIDEEWVQKALKDFDQSKIYYQNKNK